MPVNLSMRTLILTRFSLNVLVDRYLNCTPKHSYISDFAFLFKLFPLQQLNCPDVLFARRSGYTAEHSRTVTIT